MNKDKELNLTYVNGYFDDDSMQKIYDMEGKRQEFLDDIMNISEHFYGFDVKSTDRKIDYHTTFIDSKGWQQLTINIHVINESSRNEENEKEIDNKMVESLKSC